MSTLRVVDEQDLHTLKAAALRALVTSAQPPCDLSLSTILTRTRKNERTLRKTATWPSKLGVSSDSAEQPSVVLVVSKVLTKTENSPLPYECEP